LSTLELIIPTSSLEFLENCRTGAPEDKITGISKVPLAADNSARFLGFSAKHIPGRHMHAHMSLPRRRQDLKDRMANKLANIAAIALSSLSKQLFSSILFFRRCGIRRSASKISDL
jgi:hypothetical protein